MKIFYWIDYSIEKVVSAALVIAVLAILFLSCSSIVLRWFQFSQMWIDPLVRHLVFYSTFLGGVLATGRGSHIGIDLIGKYLERNNLKFYSKIITIIISFVSTFALVWLVIAAIDFSKIELEYGRAVFWGIKSGQLVSFIPIGFGMIGYRFFYIALKTIYDLMTESK